LSEVGVSFSLTHSDIAEGKGRFSKKEFIQFLYISRGSLYETITMLKIFAKKQWMDRQTYEDLYGKAEEINRMLSGLVNFLKSAHER
jgi:four helix bundle protein